MADDSLKLANAAYVDEDFDAALRHYTDAIGAQPENGGLYSARAQTHIKLEDWLSAAEDAGRAVQLEPRNAKAQFRKGVASFNLEEYETAKEAFDAAAGLEPANKTYHTWMAKCKAELDGEADMQTSGIAPSAPAAAAAPPAVKPPASAPSPAATSPAAAEPAAPPSQPSPAEATEQQPSLIPIPPRPSKYRHEWLQMQKYVEVNIFAKKLTKERVSITIGKQQLDVIIRDEQGEQEYEMSVKLYAEVNPEESRWEILSTKIELRLRKVDLSVSWPTLEASNTRPAANWTLPTEPPKTYPSSHKNVVDWNKLESDLKEEEKNEVLDGDAGVQKLFRTIYASADEDTRRAMNKSYQESNGTSLSTNWKDVSIKNQFKPPEDADVKKWEY